MRIIPRLSRTFLALALLITLAGIGHGFQRTDPTGCCAMARPDSGIVQMAEKGSDGQETHG